MASPSKRAPNLLERIGYEEEKSLEERKKSRAPDFSVPETLTSFTKPVLFSELVDSGILESCDVAANNGRLNVSGLNKLYFLLTGVERSFSVRRDFFREVRDEFDWIGGNEVSRLQQFTREGLAKIVDRYCEDVEEVNR